MWCTLLKNWIHLDSKHRSEKKRARVCGNVPWRERYVRANPYKGFIFFNETCQKRVNKRQFRLFNNEAEREREREELQQRETKRAWVVCKCAWSPTFQRIPTKQIIFNSRNRWISFRFIHSQKKTTDFYWIYINCIFLLSCDFLSRTHTRSLQFSSTSISHSQSTHVILDLKPHKLRTWNKEK